MEKVIDSFEGEYEFLSNFYFCEIKDNKGNVWKTNEHFFQAMKGKNDENRQKRIQLAPTPGKAKRLGRLITLRDDWEIVKKDIMYQALQFKFTQHKDLCKKLIDTGNKELIEGNSWGDKEWGQVNGVGKNKLGKLLMKVREELK